MGIASSNIPLDEAGIISTTLEGILYGFSVFMYGVTMWVLLYRKSTREVNRPMVVVATMLFIFSTVHLGIDIDRIIQGLLDNRNFVPGGPPAWFANPSEFTFVFKSCIYALQTITGDSVMIYRCYKVWQNIYIAIFQITLICSVITTAVGSAWACAQATPSNQAAGVFSKETGRWITAFYSSTLSTNLICTLILAWRIWQINTQVNRNSPATRSSLMPVIFVIVDAGILYSVSLLSALICFVSKSNGQYILLDMIMPIISIAFYMVIVRVGVAKVGPPSRGGMSSGAGHLNYPTTQSRGDFGMRPLEVHITQLTESQKDIEQYPGMDGSLSKREIGLSSM
ncbi:hypothetical protein DENSPDRAFT_900457 [Dentipellis sp. KUC8613]|nr:hypothetical protein DENSPDRAFT_900457 [Dentipellis sp. KUC8613]